MCKCMSMRVYMNVWGLYVSVLVYKTIFFCHRHQPNDKAMPILPVLTVYVYMCVYMNVCGSVCVCFSL